MAKSLEFFYDYVSPYSYLANSQVARIGGSKLIYRPMFLGAVMQATGNRPPGAIEVKGKYLRNDIARWAKRYGIAYNRNPKFPQDTLKALRLAIVSQHCGAFEQVHKALFEAMFVHGSDMNDDKVLAEAMRVGGLDEGETFEKLSDRSIKDELKANTDEAIGRGAFGAPTFYVGEQMFFGNDRFEFVEEALG